MDCQLCWPFQLQIFLLDGFLWDYEHCDIFLYILGDRLGVH
jgi:hypothetical protein